MRFAAGGASIIQYHILNDKRHILTKDTSNHVSYWDVLKVVALLSIHYLRLSLILMNVFPFVWFLFPHFIISLVVSHADFLWLIIQVGSSF